MLIDIDYFKGALQIPNLAKDATAFNANYINVYEPEILTKLLGNTLYQNMITNYVSGTPSIWVDLVEGKDYTVTINAVDYTVKWNGLINTEKISLIAYYVYFNYIQQNYQQATGLGIIQSNTENGTIVSPNQKLVWANNECAKLAGSYPYKLIGEPIYTPIETLEASLFYFIANNITDYPNWVYEPFKKINILGI